MPALKKHYLIVEHRSPSYELRLRQEIQALKCENEGLKRRIDDLTLLYGSEVQFNAALCDLCRERGVPFRPIFEHSKRFSGRGGA